MHRKRKIAFVSYKKQEKYSTGTHYDEDSTLLNFLLDKGLNIEHTIWNDSLIDWSKYDLAVLKSPWDYHELFADFNLWLDKLEAMRVKLANPYSIIRWNSDKHYLQDITSAGLSVIPSLFLEKETKPELTEYFSMLHTSKIIVKPCVSASAKNTWIVTPDNTSERQVELHSFLREDSFLVQPFMEEILNGEISFIFLGGRYSHSVLKLPKPGDFRVQHFHGGTIQNYEAASEYIEAAQKFISQFAHGCLYARVDGVLINGIFQLMELELIEPYLFLGLHPEGYQRYYEALLHVMDN